MGLISGGTVEADFWARMRLFSDAGLTWDEDRCVRPGLTYAKPRASVYLSWYRGRETLSAPFWFGTWVTTARHEGGWERRTRLA
jgi:hypothetical protein